MNRATEECGGPIKGEKRVNESEASRTGIQGMAAAWNKHFQQIVLARKAKNRKSLGDSRI